MVTVTDTDSLISDLQTLLTHPSPSPTITISTQTLSLPRQILSIRNHYFRVLLSNTWYKPPLTKPNTTAQQFQDLLEFLVTGCVTLPSSNISHIVALAFLANETLTTQLERVIASHVTVTISRHNIHHYLHYLHSPLPPIDEVMINYISANITVLPSLPQDLQTVKQVCHFLSARLHTWETYQQVAHYIETSKTPLRSLTNHRSLRAFLLTFPTPTFIAHLEPSNLFTRTELLHKYRDEAFQYTPPTATKPTVTLLHESSHPHPRPARLEDTVQHITVPGGGYAKLIFDKRSSLAGGAELAFYLEDPALGTHPCKFLVGAQFDKCFVLPADHFWFAFFCTEVAPEEGGVYQCRWGWRFFVQSCSPEIDYDGLS